MPEYSQKLLPVLVIKFGGISAFQYCTGNSSGSEYLLCKPKVPVGGPEHGETPKVVRRGLQKVFGTKPYETADVLKGPNPRNN